MRSVIRPTLRNLRKVGLITDRIAPSLEGFGLKLAA